MKTLNKIVVAADGSVDGCKAVDTAIHLAEKSGAQLDFVYISSHINKDIPSDLVFNAIWDKLPAGVSARKHVETGSVHKAVIELARRENADLIIMGSRGLGLFKGAFIGSKSQKVVEYSDIPVMVVK
ncbi:universal stress protein [Pectinatus haikarae]|uniref:Nucleotide-binding universal stress UspA family protein n=1 Tax=Pectinatus haikarae TaxID=349096 RepID=A0ABT9Y546_9FIRM|nr:universal stress protein [Pectinatus haikarae]MDQ0202753.1 nucleotide-binding universal stress UspA family protein [Pectinatus haikarae]